MRAEFEFLCNSHRACPRVKAELKRMGFKDVRDTQKYSPLDIVASMRLKSEEQKNEVIKKVRKKFQEDIHAIQITTRR